MTFFLAISPLLIVLVGILGLKMEMRTIPSSPSMMKRTGPGTHPDRVRFFAKTFVR